MIGDAIAIHTKAGMLFGQHFNGGPPRNFNHVFLRQFENGFIKKIGMFMFKNQNEGATLIYPSIRCLLTFFLF